MYNKETAELLENTIDPTYIPPSSEPHLIQQNELNDLARDLGLSKQQSELLGSRLQERNLLAQGTTITFFRKRNANFSVFFKIEGPICLLCFNEGDLDNLGAVLRAIKYEDFKWQICGDLKMIAILMGLQGGFTKYCCFLCLWDSRDQKQHFVKQSWPLRKSYTPGEQNVFNDPLVDPKNELLLPLHIKLGLIKNFVKGMDREGSGFKYLSELFPKLK
ncbi:hypothetical protein ACJJTC_002119 [Scirpophaga incertulas]